MTMTMQTPTMSPAFAGARKLSRFAAVLFTIAFLVMLFVVMTVPAIVIFPTTPSGVELGVGLGNGVNVGFVSLTRSQAIGAMIAVELFYLPSVLMLYHTFKLFFCFAKGEVFAAKPISHMRAAGWWLITSFFASIAAMYLLDLCDRKAFYAFNGHTLHFPGALPGLSLWYIGALLTGIATTIAAHVMEEARAIAADNAEIV